MTIALAPSVVVSCSDDCGPTAHGALAFVLLGATILVCVILVYFLLGPARALAKHCQEVELAAAAAAHGDQAFGPEQVKAAAVETFTAAYTARNAGDRDRLAQLLAPDLLAKWTAELDDEARQGSPVHVIVRPKTSIDFAGLNRPDATVVVHIVTLLGRRTATEGGKPKVRSKGADQYWTMVRRDQRWVVTEIEDRKVGKRHLADPIVA